MANKQPNTKIICFCFVFRYNTEYKAGSLNPSGSDYIAHYEATCSNIHNYIDSSIRDAKFKRALRSHFLTHFTKNFCHFLTPKVKSGTDMINPSIESSDFLFWQKKLFELDF